MPDLAPNPKVDTVRVPNPLTDSIATGRNIQDALGKLKQEDADQIRSLLKGDMTDEVKERLSRITTLDAFKKASGEPMVAMLTQIANETRDSRSTGLSWVIKEPNFARLDSKDQVAIIELLGRSSGSVAVGEQLGKLLTLTGPDGKPLLLSKDSKGNTVLDNLTTFTKATFHRDVTAAGITPTKALGDVLREINDAVAHVDQGNRGACAAASLQDLLCREQPAEFIRLVTGLMVNKSVEMRGGTLTVAAGSLVPQKDKALGQPDLRSHSERIFQSALLDRVSSLGSYSYADDGSKLDVPKSLFGNVAGSLLPGSIALPFGGGMTSSQMVDAMAMVFGKDNYEYVSGRGSSVHGALKRSGSPAVISMHWDGGLHALVYVKSDDKFAYLKDPNGGSPEQPISVSNERRFLRKLGLIFEFRSTSSNRILKMLTSNGRPERLRHRFHGAMCCQALPPHRC